MHPAYTHTCVFTPLQADNSSNCTNHSRPHQPKNFIFNTELAWALHCLFTPIPPFYSHKAAGSISSWVGSPCREQGSPSDASDRHWLHPASPSVAHHASSLQALLSCLHTNHSSSTKKGLHFPSKAPGKKKKKKMQCLGFLLNKRVRSTLEIQAILMGNLAAMKTEHCKSSFAVR